MNTTELLNISNICFSYPHGPPILKDISFSLKTGELLHLQGKNGSGKSTLIKLILKKLKTQKGKIIMNCEQHHVGLLSQNPAKTGETPYKALDIVRMGDPRFFSRNKELALEWLKVMNLDDKANHRIHELSGGEVRRVFIANALMGEIKLLILDEPFTNLDKNSVDVIEKLIEKLLSQKNLAILATTHGHQFKNYHQQIILE